MQIGLLIFHGIVIILFVIFGVVFFRGKGASLIAGYNTSSKAEKEKYDKLALCKFMGKLMFALAACWVFVAVGSALPLSVLHVIGMALFFVIIFAAVIYTNTGNRFKK